MDKKNKNIVYITDENYVMPTIVSIMSLITNKKNNIKYNVIVLLNNVSHESKRYFLSLNKDDVEITTKDINLNDFIPENVKQKTHVTKTALLKFFLPYILKDIDTVLYLDCDTLVLSDLCEIFDTNLGDKYAATVCGKNGEFNSGVMYLNLVKLRNENIPEILLNCKLNNDYFFMDQDVLNKVFSFNIHKLDYSYNYCVCNRFCVQNKKSEQIQKIKNAKILHFICEGKPWLFHREYLTRLYMKYHRLSPFSNERLRPHNNISLFLKMLILQNIF